jgi:Leucine-rich repeat (LRR) protein
LNLLVCLKNSKLLVLSHNEISDYRGCGLKELRQLSLSCNQLQQFPDLKENSKLRQLRLNGNQIMELPKEKDNFPSWLEILDLGNNQIKKLSQVKGLMHCSRLRNLNLKGNPVCDTPMYKEALCALIPTLRILDGQPLEKKKKEEEQFNETDRLDKHVNDIEQASPLKKKRKATEEPAERTPIKNTKKKSVKEKEPANEAKDISGVIKVIETKKSKEAIDPSNLLTEMAEIPGWD